MFDALTSPVPLGVPLKPPDARVLVSRSACESSARRRLSWGSPQGGISGACGAWRHGLAECDDGGVRVASFEDRQDFEDAERGRIAGLSPGVVTTADGRPVWDVGAYRFLDGDCPDTVNPSLWRQSQLCARQGLFEVTEGVYQIRGIDLSNMSLIEGERGVIVVDPLVSAETAAAGLKLYREHRGGKPVTAVIYTHCHFDHFGGVLGVVDQDTEVPILAPEGFMEHAVSENVYAGTAMLRRSAYYGGVNLERGPAGLVGMGLG